MPRPAGARPPRLRRGDEHGSEEAAEQAGVESNGGDPLRGSPVDPEDLARGQSLLGGEADLLAIVRDDRGQPMDKAEVNFRADIGTLESGGALISAGPDGTAADRLHVTPGDFDAVSGDAQPGTYAVTFRATNSLGSDEVTKFVQVTGQ